MLRIAVTGGIACGKSRVGSFLAVEGAAICDADDLAHQVMEPGHDVHNAVVRAFGHDILSEDGKIDRRKLSALVFPDREKLLLLNSIVHPAVAGEWQAWLVDRQADSGVAAVIVPLLFEAGMDGGWDAVVCVSASRQVQLRRLADRGIAAEDANRRIAAQMAVGDKRILSDYVIHNDGTETMLMEQTRRVVRSILEK
jgi:dephospho-CoA kinase